MSSFDESNPLAHNVKVEDPSKFVVPYITWSIGNYHKTSHFRT